MPNAIDDIGARSNLNLEINSAARCCESAKLPPFPQKIIFPPFLIDSRQLFANIYNCDIILSSFRMSFLALIDLSISLNMSFLI